MGHNKISKVQWCELVGDLMLAGQVWDSMGSLRRLFVFDEGPRQTLDMSTCVSCSW